MPFWEGFPGPTASETTNPSCTQRPAAHLCIDLAHLFQRLSVTYIFLPYSGSVPRPFRGNRVQGNALCPAAALLQVSGNTKSQLISKSLAEILAPCWHRTGRGRPGSSCSSAPKYGKATAPGPKHMYSWHVALLFLFTKEMQCCS